MFGQTCGTCRLHFFEQAGHGRGQRPAFLAPSMWRGRDFEHHSGAEGVARRWMLVPLTSPMLFEIVDQVMSLASW
ncbi:hypothetical protein ACQR16_08870 [Bradyrhizobium oligotrophicum]|uniref:hypothetical protein n=1 Tax=Bradyrhizobium oligotrophicum TaxID=44255 RepID=UPI003EB865E0